MPITDSVKMDAQGNVVPPPQVLTDNDFDADFNALRAAIRDAAQGKDFTKISVDPVLHIAQRFLWALEEIAQNTRSIT